MSKKKNVIVPVFDGDCFQVIVANGQEAVCAEVGELSLRATIEIAGGLYPFGEMPNTEAFENAALQADRYAAWSDGLAFARVMAKRAAHRRYMVRWEAQSDMCREAVRVYRVLEPYKL